MKKFKQIYRKNLKEHFNGVPHQHPHFQMNYNDYEGRMAKQNLFKLHKYSKELFEMLDDHVEMESWVQEKISKAADYISTVKHYLEYEMQFGPEKNPYDSHEDDDMYEDVHHIDDLIPLLKKIVKVQESQTLVLKDKMHVIVEPDDAKSLLFAYKELNEENKKKFSLNLFENKKQFWNMVSFSKSRGE